MKSIYTAEQIDFLRREYQSMTVAQLTPAFNDFFGTNRTKCSIKSGLTRYKITSNGCAGKKIGSKIFSRDDIEFIKNFYRIFTRKELADILSRSNPVRITPEQIKALCGRYRIRSGRSGRFEKGNRPGTAGTKGMGICKPNSGSFSQGHIPGNIKPMWDERIDSDRYVWMKIPEKNPHTGHKTCYRLKHDYVWEKANGPIPDGHAVIFRDGDRGNCALENLELVSRAELLRLNNNGFGGAAPEIKPAIIALSKMEATMFEKNATLKPKRKNPCNHQ